MLNQILINQMQLAINQMKDSIGLLAGQVEYCQRQLDKLKEADKC